MDPVVEIERTTAAPIDANPQIAGRNSSGLERIAVDDMRKLAEPRHLLTVLCRIFGGHAGGRRFSRFGQAALDLFVDLDDRLVPVVVVVGLTITQAGHTVALHAVGLVAVEEFPSLGDRFRQIDVGWHVGDDDLGRRSRLPFLRHGRECLVHQKLTGLGQDPLGVVIKFEIGAHQREFCLAADAQVFDVFSKRVDFRLTEQRKRRHRRASDTVSKDPQHIRMGRLVGPFGALELEDPGAVIARIWVEKRRGRPHPVTGHAMAVGTVFTVEAVLPSHDVAADWPTRKPEFGFIKPRFGKDHRVVRRAEHGEQNRRDLPFLIRRETLLRGLHHVEAVGGGGSLSAPDRQQTCGKNGDGEERNVRKPVHRGSLLSI